MNAVVRIMPGFLLPTIFEPSQRMKVSQKIYIIVGVPMPARVRKPADSVVRIEPMIATSFLNQRFRSKMINKPENTPMIMDGSLIE